MSGTVFSGRRVQRVTLTRTQRYHAEMHAVGFGSIYRGRYKSLPVERDEHFLAMVRYVERNPKRAALVKRAQDWEWSSAYARMYGSKEQKKLLSPWPAPAPEHYLRWLNQPQAKEEIENTRYAVKRSRPYGSEWWVQRAVAKFGLESTMRPRGRPKIGT